MDLNRSQPTDIEAMFSGQGWLVEHPAAFRSLMLS